MTSSLRIAALLLVLFIGIITISCNHAAGQNPTATNAKFKEYKVIRQEVNPMLSNADQNFKAFESNVKAALNDGWTLVAALMILAVIFRRQWQDNLQ